MSGLRLVGRGLSDNLERLLPFTLASLGWWCCVFSVIFAPGATLTLFKIVDPRLGEGTPDWNWRSAWRDTRRQTGRGWRLAALTAPIPLIALWNPRFYALGESPFAFLVPFWLLVFVIAMAIGLTAFAIAALFSIAPGEAVRLAATVTILNLPRVLVMAISLGLLFALGTLLVVPLFTFLPALLAATVTRFALASLHVPVVDPLEPTSERRTEEAKERAARRLGP